MMKPAVILKASPIYFFFFLILVYIVVYYNVRSVYYVIIIIIYIYQKPKSLVVWEGDLTSLFFSKVAK